MSDGWWVLRVTSPMRTEYHAVPLVDTREHVVELNERCWCVPKEEETKSRRTGEVFVVATHNSADKRELTESDHRVKLPPT